MKRKGVIAAGNRYTAEAGLEILREGGNAFDAVIAATLTSCVAEPTFTSAGGGGFLMAHTKNGDNILFDYFAQTPGSRENLSEIDFYPIKFNFGDAIQYFHIGLGSAAVPGMLAGLFHVHKKLGKMPFRELAAPAIEGAGKGFVITSQLADFLELVREVITSTPDAREIFMRNGQLLKEGDTLKVANYAGFLEFIAHEGIDEFYCGEIAERIAKDSRERGGLLR
ncbi:MAG: gamma-glutamyltransferase, partial [Bacteroidetes bacterium]|nr:gamma-glutamyltransferase [Bacteroidota bacterium]